MSFDGCSTISAQAFKPEPDAEGFCLKGHETILLVDDEAVVVEVTREILETLGYRVFTAWTGTEAIAMYRSGEEKIDLVILDMILSGLSGAETFDRLRAMDPQIKVILSTGYSLMGQAKLIMARGCSGFIQKPFRIEELSQKVREVLDHNNGQVNVSETNLISLPSMPGSLPRG
jgi:CheY-like chemotaxis protein